MDYGFLGFLAVAGVVAAVWALGRQSQVLGLDLFMLMVTDIVNRGELTAVQKRHDTETVYRKHAGKTVSLVGMLEDVFPNRAVVTTPSSRSFPRLGFDILRIRDERLRSLSKGKAVTLRGRLPRWSGTPEIESLPEQLRDARVFGDGRWYPVKNVFVARAAGGQKAPAAVAENQKGKT